MTAIQLTAKQEAYAIALANNESVADLYAKTHPKATRKTCTEQASRITKNRNVSARAEELRLAQSAIKAACYDEKAASVAEQFKGKLLTPFRRRELLRRRAEHKDVTDAALVAILKLDAELAGEFKIVSELTGKDGTPLPSIVPEIVVNYLPPHMARPRIPKDTGK